MKKLINVLASVCLAAIVGCGDSESQYRANEGSYESPYAERVYQMESQHIDQVYDTINAHSRAVGYKTIN